MENSSNTKLSEVRERMKTSSRKKSRTLVRPWSIQRYFGANQTVVLPKYVRVNLNKMTLEKVIEQFKKEGYKLLENADASTLR